ncbi:MAG: anti-oxidant AhpCTSA family protein [Bacteroidetes bacterium]|nr:MAG: anti-oxidant AhpCTSA family protein [Bacteroidota bacterium]
MPVIVGQPAPSFTLPTDELKPLSLDTMRGHKVLLLFFPGAFTSVCTTELNQVNNDLDSFGENTRVLGISTDSPFVLKEFKRVHGLSFPLLSDHDATVSALYGAKYDRDFTDMKLDRIARRAVFVLDEEGIVRYAEVLENAGDLPDFDQIKSVLHA